MLERLEVRFTVGPQMAPSTLATLQERLGARDGDQILAYSSGRVELVRPVQEEDVLPVLASLSD